MADRSKEIEKRILSHDITTLNEVDKGLGGV
jgi:hypothetical protein